jgi:hypothetical protein
MYLDECSFALDVKSDSDNLFIFTFEHVEKSLCVHKKMEALRINFDKDAQLYLKKLTTARVKLSTEQKYTPGTTITPTTNKNGISKRKTFNDRKADDSLLNQLFLPTTQNKLMGPN